MILNREKRKKRRVQTDEAIHIVALWNLMLILIPFLLLSADFSRTSILNLIIPSTSNSTSSAKIESTKSHDAIQLTLKADGFILTQGALQKRVIPLKSGNFDFTALFVALEELKKQNPEQETIVLSGSPNVSYEAVVQAMDECREASFSNIMLGAESTGDNI